MPRKYIFDGPFIEEKSLVIGNHDHVQLVVRGDFVIDGLVYCPRYSLGLSLQGEGSVTLHGICRRVILRKVNGNCLVNLEELLVRELSCEDLGPNSILRMQTPRVILERNIHASAEVFFDGGRKSIKQSVGSAELKTQLSGGEEWSVCSG
jgi:hypothetical protein